MRINILLSFASVHRNDTGHYQGIVILSYAERCIQGAVCVFLQIRRLVTGPFTHTCNPRIIARAKIKSLLLDCPCKNSDSPSLTYDVVVQKASTSPPLSRSRPSPHQSSRRRTALNNVQAKRQTRLVLVIRFSKTPRGYIPAWCEGP